MEYEDEASHDGGHRHHRHRHRSWLSSAAWRREVGHGRRRCVVGSTRPENPCDGQRWRIPTPRTTTLTFAIYDGRRQPRRAAERALWLGGVSATFGNDVTAICTGKIAGDGVLHATGAGDLAPSGYENASSALSVSCVCSSTATRSSTSRVKVSGTASGFPKAAGCGRPLLCWQTLTPARRFRRARRRALSDEIAEGSSSRDHRQLVGRWQVHGHRCGA